MKAPVWRLYVLEPVTQGPNLGWGVWEGLPREVAFELGFEG